jgi:hypothetical protein
VADQREAWNEDVSDRLLQLESHVRRLQRATTILTVIVVLLVLVGRETILGGVILVVLFLFALAFVPLIVFGGMKLLDRWFPTK